MLNILALLNLINFLVKYWVQTLKKAKLATNTDLANVEQLLS